MAKRGKQYEVAVGEILKKIYPDAKVKVGHWINGPDGRRELDIDVEVDVNGKLLKGTVECKDFNASSPVGIEYIDALDSKRRDIGADFALICSNAGFTSGALRKAKRVGIKLVGVLQKGDARIRTAIIDEFYTRRLTLTLLQLTLDCSPPVELHAVPFKQIYFGGLPVARWIFNRVLNVLASNAVTDGDFSDMFRFAKPQQFEWPGGRGTATSMTIRYVLQGTWVAHEVTIEATAATYDWATGILVVAPGDGSMQIDGLDFRGGQPMTSAPDRELVQRTINAGEVSAKYFSLDRSAELEEFVPGMEAPALDEVILPEDRNPEIPGRGFFKV